MTPSEHYWHRVAKGQCTQCPAPAQPNRRCCQACALKQASRSTARRRAADERTTEQKLLDGKRLAYVTVKARKKRTRAMLAAKVLSYTTLKERGEQVPG